MKSNYPHMISACLAILIMSGLPVYGTVYAHSIEQKYVHVLAPLMIPQSNIGSALQQAAFEQPDLLVIYGSSEILIGNNSPYSAIQLFQNYPTGFNAYEVAKNGASSLDIAQDLASIGPELRGKKVVFSFTPSIFINGPAFFSIAPANPGAVNPYAAAYAADFSLLHANALIFNLSLSYATKQLAAQRMNSFPDTLQGDPLLQFAIRQLTCSCFFGSTLYELALPLGQLDTWSIRLQDHWEVLSYIWKHPKLNPVVTRRPARIDWASEIAQGVQADKIASNNNPYGIYNLDWTNIYSKPLSPPKKPGTSDALYIQNLDNSKEWTDFDLVLQVLKELGAKPLILSRPINGRIWSALGVSSLARQAYYDKLQNTISPYAFPFVDFENHENDKYFSIDPAPHTGPEGWIYVDQTFDAFFHNRIH